MSERKVKLDSKEAVKFVEEAWNKDIQSTMLDYIRVPVIVLDTCGAPYLFFVLRRFPISPRHLVCPFRATVHALTHV